MEKKEKFELEYLVRSSLPILFNCLSTANGLSEWFAEKVDFHENICTFSWNKVEDYAKIIEIQKDKHIRFQWEEDEEEHPYSYFEFQLHPNPLTKEITLKVIDFSFPDEIEKNKNLWDKQINNLLLRIGC